jgi:hypothetical protein
VTDSSEPPFLLHALQRAGEELERRQLPWALVGGLAVSIRAEPRFTRNIDLAVAVSSDGAAEALITDLCPAGYGLHATLAQDALGRLATVRLTPPASSAGGIVLDLLFASSSIELDICRAAELLEIVPGLVVPVARSGHLVAMKLLSRAEDRLQDALDLRHLAGVLTPDEVALARGAVERIEAIGANRGRQLRADLGRYLASAGAGLG